MAGTKVRIVGGVAALIISIGLAAWAVWVWRGAGASGERESREPETPPVSIRESVIRHSEGGRLNWQLAVKDIEMSAGGRTVAAEGLKDGLLYDAEGRPVLRLTAGQAKYNTVRKDFELTGSVEAVSHRGAVITTEKVQWVPEEQTLRCPGQVTMKAEGITLTADNLDLLVAQDMVKCPDRVRMRMGEDRLSGRDLAYNLVTHNFTFRDMQGVFAPQTAREKLERLR